MIYEVIFHNKLSQQLNKLHNALKFAKNRSDTGLVGYSQHKQVRYFAAISQPACL